MNKKVILSVVVSVIVLLVGIPFFMYGEDSYSFPQALLMVVLIDLLCYSPVNWVIAKESDETSVLKQILGYIIVSINHCLVKLSQTLLSTVLTSLVVAGVWSSSNSTV